MKGGILPDYQQTITYRQATEIYELTKDFCHQYLHPIQNSRLIDQMISSARLVKQNLAEGATRNSIKDYIQFIGYSRASGEELLEDCRDLAKE
jgi:four helix bundle protein